MANARDVYNVDANKAGLADPQNKQFDLSFPYLSQSHVSVTVNGTATTAFTYATSTRIQLNTGPTAGDVVVIKRATSPNTRLVDYQTGSVLSDEILDRDSLQAFYLAQEANDVADIVLSKNASNLFDAGNERITNVADPTGAQDVATKNYLENTWLSASDKTQLNALNTTNLNTVAGAVSNVNTVAGAITNVNTVAGKNTQIGLLGTSDAVNDMNVLGTEGIVQDLNLLGTAANVAAMATLGTSANVTNMSTLGASGVVANIATVAGVASTMSAAATNATNAASSASAASGSAAASANSAAAAATALDSFDDRYLGAKSSEPSVDNDGNALVSGALFFDSTAGSMKVYDGANWILATSAGASSLLDYEFTATAGQTTFSGSDNNSATLSYSAGNLIVTLNGIVLDNGSDYTATSGTSIVLASGAALNDHLAVVAFKSFTVADTVPASTGGTFAGGVTVSGTLTANAAQVNGNIAVTGTVDGRDVAADGTKLDTNIPSSLGAAGQVLTVNPAGNAGSWVEASGGGEQTFTASGSISAGNIVGINSSGTVEVMQQELSGVSQLGTANPYVPDYLPIAADTDGNGKVLVVVAVSGGRPLAYVGTVSATTISFGSAVEVTTATNQLKPSVTYDANAGKFLVFWYDHNGTYSNKAAVGTISGTTVSFGSIITVASSSREGQVLYNPDTQSSLILYLNNSYVLYAKVATISGTSVSVGSALTVDSGTNRYPRLSYDTTANKYVAAYKYNNAGTAKVLTVSGTSVTAGSRATFDSNAVHWIGTAYNPTANRHIMQYYVGGGASIVAGTISGTSITFGTPVTLPATLLSSPYYDPITQKTILTSARPTYYAVIFGSGNAITVGETTQWLFDTVVTSPANAGPRLVNLNSTRNFWVFEYGNTVRYQVTNEAMAKFVGLAKENISNGATGKVTVMGGINTSVSSLTAGKSYGLPADSAVITEITDQGSTKIFGTALSATSIYIDKGNLR